VEQRTHAKDAVEEQAEHAALMEDRLRELVELHGEPPAEKPDKRDVLAQYRNAANYLQEAELAQSEAAEARKKATNAAARVAEFNFTSDAEFESVIAATECRRDNLRRNCEVLSVEIDDLVAQVNEKRLELEALKGIATQAASEIDRFKRGWDAFSDATTWADQAAKKESLAATLPEAREAEAIAQEAVLAVESIERAINTRGNLVDSRLALANRTNRYTSLDDAIKRVDEEIASLAGRLHPDLSVREGLLIHNHRDRGPVAFGDLSRGERTVVITEFAIRSVGAGGEVTLPQELWEGLDPENRVHLSRCAEECGVIVYTAECDAGPVRAELFSETSIKEG
jgi:chromosome segregation ATPase